MTARFIALADYAIGTGVRGILFTCSAFGPCIDAVARRWPDIPVLKPNEAMIADAMKIGRRIGLVGSFAPTLVSMPAEFPADITVLPVLAEGALDALTLGDTHLHDRLVVQAAQQVAAKGCDAVALAQFSLARAAPLVEHAVRVPVLTTVGSAVRLLRERVEQARPGNQGYSGSASSHETLCAHNRTSVVHDLRVNFRFGCAVLGLDGVCARFARRAHRPPEYSRSPALDRAAAKR